MTLARPDYADKFDALKSWACWATGLRVVWENQATKQIREAGRPWGELSFQSLAPVGPDVTVYEDVDNDDGDAVNPRQDLICGHRILNVLLRTKSRSQEHRASAWFALAQAQGKYRSSYGRSQFLDPNDLKLNEVGEVLSLPPILHDNRLEDVAVLELSYNTVFVDTDLAAIGTWIEQAEVTSDFRDLDDSLQLAAELMPPA